MLGREPVARVGALAGHCPLAKNLSRSRREVERQRLRKRIIQPLGDRDSIFGCGACALAVACKGIGLERAAFSTIAVLTDKTRAADDSYLRLAVYDTIPQGAAARLLTYWRKHPDPGFTPLDHAAE